jgi:hypothetical protein
LRIYILQTPRERHVFETPTAGKGAWANGRHALWNINGRQFTARLETTIIDSCQLSAQDSASYQTSTIIEGITYDSLHTGGDGDGHQTTARLESATFYRLQTIGKRDG